MSDPFAHLTIGVQADPELLLRCTGAPLCQGWTTLSYGTSLASPNALRRALAEKNWATGNGEGDDGTKVLSPLCPDCAARILKKGGGITVDASGGAAENISSDDKAIIKAN